MRLASITWGNSAAHTAPCGAGNMPPMGAAKPCTGASRRGNRDDRHGRVGQRPGATDEFEIIKNFASICRQGGDGFGGVDRAAAAEADDEVAFLAASELNTTFDVFDRWFSGDREHPPGDSLLSEQAIQNGRPASR